MRFRALTLQSYGVFDEARFDFTREARGPDLHLVVGDNETGKTTLKHALVHALFGVPRNSPYLWRGRQAELTVELEIDGAAHTLHRLRQKATPASAAYALQASLARADVTLETYLVKQAFSHAEMREHSRALHDSKGDLRDLLLRDAGGLTRALQCLKSLQEEADELFARDSRRKTRFRLLDTQRKAALEDYAATELSAPEYEALRQAVRSAEAACQEAGKRKADAEEERDSLDRLIRAQAPAQRLQALDANAGTGDVALLLPDAERRVGECAQEVARAQEAHKGALEERETLEEARRDLVIDREVLEQEAKIVALRRQSERLTSPIEKRPLQRRQTAERRRAALDRARRLGLDVPRQGEGADDLASLLPPAVTRREAERHKGREGEVRLALTNAREQLEAVERAREPEVPPPPGEALTGALRRVDRLGAYPERKAAAQTAVAEAERALAIKLDAAGTAADHADVPALEEGRRAESRIAEAAQFERAASEALRHHAATLAELHEVSRRTTTSGVPTASAIGAVREERDSLWQAFLDGADLAAHASEYERLTEQADALADERFDKVEAIVRAEKAEVELAAAQARHRVLEAQQQDAAQDLVEARKAWGGRLATFGITEPPDDYAAWSERRSAAIDARKVLRGAVEDRDALDRAMADALAACHGALDEAAPKACPDLVGALEAVEARLRGHREALSEARSDALAAHKAYLTAQADRPARIQAVATASAAFDAWQARWEDFADLCFVPRETSHEHLSDVCAEMMAIEEDLAAADAAEREAQETDAQEAAHDEALAAAAEALGEPRGTTLQRLVERLEAAHTARKEAARLDAELARRASAETEARGKLQKARTAMAGDFAAASLSADAPVAALIAAAQASDRRRAEDAERTRLIGEIEALGLAWPSARDALAKMSIAERRAAHEGLSADAKAFADAQLDAASELGRVKRALEDKTKESRSGEGAAARARFAQRTLEREMAEVAMEAIRRRLEVAVLEEARRVFADQNRSPILQRAEAIFSRFTDGAYDALILTGIDSNFLHAHRVADDLDVAVTGLSDGTRDQLVTSVRLAAAQDCALPFIADDLFVNADDGRAARGFQTLADLARERQVIYLTHHAHLVEVARSAVGGGLNVVTIGDAAWETAALEPAL